MLTARSNSGEMVTILDPETFANQPGVTGNWVVYSDGYPIGDIERGVFTPTPLPRGRMAGKPSTDRGRKCSAPRKPNAPVGGQSFPRIVWIHA